MKKNNFLLSCFFGIMGFFVASVCGCSDNEENTPETIYSITTDLESVVFDENGGDLPLVINTNAPYQINTSSNWVAYTPSQSDAAVSNCTVVFSVPANTAYTVRRTTISIKSGDIASDFVVRKFIEIVQAGAPKPEREPGLYTKSDILALAEAISGDQDYSEWEDKDGVINLMNDIDFGSDLIPCMGGQSSSNTCDITVSAADAAFGGHFNGNGHTIKGALDGGDKMLVALFTRLAPEGIIENLTVDVDANSTYTASNGHVACLVGFSLTSTSGYIKNCKSKGSVRQTGAAGTRAGGIIAYGRCNIEDCENYASLNVQCNRVAGISGAGGGTNYIKNSKNHGAITVDCLSAQVGGIIGQQNGQSILGCSNDGNITVNSWASVYVGGLVGQGKGNCVIGGADAADKCTNTGTITMNEAAVAAKDAGIGGIAGNIAAVVALTNCENRGTVSSKVGQASVYVGGLVGYMSKEAPVSQSVNSGAVSGAQYVGGIIGKATAASPIKGCSNTGAISQLPGSSLPASYFGGIIGDKGKATYTECIFGGTVLGLPGSESNAEGH